MHTLQDLPSSAPSSATSSTGQLSLPTPGADSKYLLLVSGLHIGNPAPAQGNVVLLSGISSADCHSIRPEAMDVSDAVILIDITSDAFHTLYLLSHAAHPVLSSTPADPAAGPHTAGASELSAQLLMDFVAGRLSGNAAHIDLASRITRCVPCCWYAAVCHIRHEGVVWNVCCVGDAAEARQSLIHCNSISCLVDYCSVLLMSGCIALFSCAE
jgi:hypothetical protein